MSEEVYVTGVKRFDYDGKVYDINVEDEHNYVVDDVVVHNSAAGSEVCYLLDITKIDPLKNGLMFERFLNPERFNYPDIDTDLQSVVNSSSDSGKDILMKSMSCDLFPFSGQIVNEMRASTLVLFKQLAKVFSLSFKDVNRLTTDDEVSDVLLMQDEYTYWLPDQLKRLDISWTPAWEEFEKYIPFAYKYGGSERGDKANGILINTSAHASGVILYPVNDQNILPKNSQGITYRGHDLEEMGFIKYDLLGLSTLDPISYFMPTLIREKGITIPDRDNNGNIRLDKNGNQIYKTIFDWENTDDPETWDVFCRADTDFVFQFASPGMKRALRITKPRTIAKLAELNALYRPGCIKAGILEQYLKNEFSDDAIIVGKHLKEVFGEDHSYAMIFQEDIMKVVQDMAGFTLGEADLVRRAMQRKEHDRMASYKEQFINNFKTDIYGDIAENVWAAINEFASYAFNKSHSVAYACIAYWTAYIYCHHKNELFEYMLNSNMDKQKVITFVSKDHKIIFPSLKTKNTKYVVTDTELLIPTTAVTDQSLAQYLLSLDKDKKEMIMRYGVLDDFCIDRKNLRDLFDSIPKKTINSLTDQQIDGLNTNNINELINRLSALDIIDFKRNGIVYNIEVKKPKSVKKINLCTFPTKEILVNNCQEDIRRYGIVREKYADSAPEIDTDKIETMLENRVSNINDTSSMDESMILRDILRNHSTDVSEVESKPYRCVLKKAYLTGYPKVELVFSNDVIKVGLVSPRKLVSKIKAMPSCTPVEVHFAVDGYYKRDTKEISINIKVEDINVRSC